jgi:hypothetical protein
VIPVRILLAAALLITASPLSGQRDEYTHTIARIQRVELVNHHPACNPFAMAYDPVSWDGRQGIHAPRVVIHAGWVLVNTGIDWTLRKATAPSWLRVAVVRAGLPLTPHVIQIARGLANGGTARVNLYDYVYDFNLKQSLLGVSRAEGVTRVLLDVPLSCFARP